MFDKIMGGVVVAWILVLLACIPAYITHVVVMLMNIFDGKGNVIVELLVLVLGILLAPIGVIHGWMVWFGFEVTEMINTQPAVISMLGM